MGKPATAWQARAQGGIVHWFTSRTLTRTPWKKTSCSLTAKPSCASIICFSLRTVRESWIRRGIGFLGVPSSIRMLWNKANIWEWKTTTDTEQPPSQRAYNELNVPNIDRIGHSWLARIVSHGHCKTSRKWLLAVGALKWRGSDESDDRSLKLLRKRNPVLWPTAPG